MAITKAELKRFRALLKVKQAETAGALGNREEIAIQKAADALDEVQLAGERELAISNLDRESNLLRAVRSALRRIADQCYGICVHCEQDISSKRLSAVPWTAYCIKCQELADRREFEREEAFDGMLAER
jgi:DnaK suppressor protein